jgi:hypothetical protein
MNQRMDAVGKEGTLGGTKNSNGFGDGSDWPKKKKKLRFRRLRSEGLWFTAANTKRIVLLSPCFFFIHGSVGIEFNAFCPWSCASAECIPVSAGSSSPGIHFISFLFFFAHLFWMTGCEYAIDEQPFFVSEELLRSNLLPGVVYTVRSQ